MQGKKLTLNVLAAATLVVMMGVAHAHPASGGPRSSAAIVDRLDTDGDGAISLTEFTDAAATRAEMRFSRVDQNADGEVTRDEIGPNQREIPEDFDRDAFRACVAEQLGVELPDRPDADARFEEADLDGNGAIDLNEAVSNATSRAMDRFAELDADGDGLLVSDEISRPRHRSRALREARRACKEQNQEISALLGT